MAVRFNASADNLDRGTVLNYNSAYTAMMWTYLVSGAGGTWCVPLFFSDGGWANNDGFGVDDNSPYEFVPFVTVSDVFSADGSGAVSPSNGTWYHTALVRESTTSLKMYVDGALQGTVTANVSGRASAANMRLGNSALSDSPMDGRVCATKIWTRALTLAEVNAEMRTIRPLDTTSLWGWYPNFPGSGERARDYSGNGRNWTEGGTLTDEDPPPVSYGGQSIFFPLVTAAVATKAPPPFQRKQQVWHLRR